MATGSIADSADIDDMANVWQRETKEQALWKTACIRRAGGSLYAQRRGVTAWASAGIAGDAK